MSEAVNTCDKTSFDITCRLFYAFLTFCCFFLLSVKKNTVNGVVIVRDIKNFMGRKHSEQTFSVYARNNSIQETRERGLYD